MLRNQEEHGKNPARESVDEHRVLNAKSVSPELLAATIHELSTKSSHNAAVSTTQSSWQPSQQFSLSRRQSNRFNNHSQFGKSYHHHPKVRQDQNQVKDPKLESLAVFRDHYANFRRICHGVRNQEAKKQIFQVCAHHH
jgi:hypothetical protein